MPSGLTSPAHLLVIIVVGLVVLGPEKLPQALRQVGRAVAEYRRWTDTVRVEMQDALSLDTTGEEAPVLAASPPPETPETPEPPAGSSPHPARREGGEWA
jgi:Tat protein translocase TatB subunit